MYLSTYSTCTDVMSLTNLDEYAISIDITIASVPLITKVITCISSRGGRGGTMTLASTQFKAIVLSIELYLVAIFLDQFDTYLYNKGIIDTYLYLLFTYTHYLNR